MTPNTSPKKPAWFVLIESDAPSAQVRKVDKKLPAATAFAALAIVASGTFFANGSSTSQSPAAGTLASSAGVTSVDDSINGSSKAISAKQAAPQAVNAIADPSLNGGGDDDGDDDDYDDDDYDDDDNREDDDDRGDDEEDDD
jgi:hypothetical protein